MQEPEVVQDEASDEPIAGGLLESGQTARASCGCSPAASHARTLRVTRADQALLSFALATM